MPSSLFGDRSCQSGGVACHSGEHTGAACVWVRVCDVVGLWLGVGIAHKRVGRKQSLIWLIHTWRAVLRHTTYERWEVHPGGPLATCVIASCSMQNKQSSIVACAEYSIEEGKNSKVVVLKFEGNQEHSAYALACSMRRVQGV